MKQWSKPIGCALALALAGCASIRPPDFAHPGSAGYQRAVGDYYDPYPLDDVAPPVVGGRPREYQRPVPEVDRARQFSPPQTAPVGLPSFSPTASVVPAPPPVATPYAQPVQPAPATLIRPPY